MEYTKGEWEVQPYGNGDFYVQSSLGRDITHVHSYTVDRGSHIARANAQLIALSPKMAKLLKHMVEDGWSTAIAIEAKEILQTLDL